MKVLIIGLLVTVINSASASDGKCACATFLRSPDDKSTPDLTSRMYLKEDGQVDGCEGADAQKACSDLCVNSIGLATDHGNLDFVRPDGKSVGDLACSLLHRDITNGEVAAFSKLCDGEWTFAKASTPEHLCCTGGRSVVCA